MAHRGEGGSLQGTPELGVCVFILCSVLTLVGVPAASPSRASTPCVQYYAIYRHNGTR
jgi:hypothetical protein